MNENHEIKGMQQEELHRGLKERHIQLIAIGGTIGVGLFLGSASAIKVAGPSLLLSYALGGTILFFVMRALGEMAVEMPVSGSFSAYANQFLGPIWGYLVGWTYWLQWVVGIMAEMTAVGIYINFWWPNFPQWLSALICLAVLTIINLTAVSAYGEFEFWFALIKVVTIIALIIIGLLMIIFGLGNGGKPIGISNLWMHGGFFPNGIKGPILAMVMVTWAFLGAELLGITAGEAKNPDKTIPSAINKVFYRILIFYIGSMFVILSIYPWNQLGTLGSPFVSTFAKLGIAAAAGIINFVVLTSASSGSNSAIFTTGRMLYTLSLQGLAPKYLGKVNAKSVPANAILTSVAVGSIAVILNYIMPGKIFSCIASISCFAGLFAWFVICFCQIKFRKTLTPEQIKNLKFPMILFPLGNYIVMAFLAFVVAVMTMSPDTSVALIVGSVWLVILVAIYYGRGLNKVANNTESISK